MVIGFSIPVVADAPIHHVSLLKHLMPMRYDPPKAFYTERDAKECGLRLFFHKKKENPTAVLNRVVVTKYDNSQNWTAKRRPAPFEAVKQERMAAKKSYTPSGLLDGNAVAGII